MTTKRTYAVRLLTLAAYLETLKPSQYSHDSYYSVPSTWGFRTRYKADGAPQCGTVACALGHAAVCGAFRDAGLRVGTFGGGIFVPYHIGDVRNKDTRLAAETVFGPRSYDAIFGNFAIPHHTPNQVAKVIREFVRDEYGYEQA